MALLDGKRIRADFPILEREIYPGVPLVYLDSTATTQKPRIVLESMDSFYRNNNANIHRGIHVLAEESTAQYETSRDKVADFIHAPSSKQVIFTRNTTDSINLVTNTWGRVNLNQGDLVILTEMEHHSNLFPWQMLAAERGIKLEFIPVTGSGLLDLQVYEQLLKQEPKLVAFTHMSNVLGTINPAMEIIHMAHAAGALTLVDGAQSVPHFPVDVIDLDMDFLAFSAHKMLGPTGIGVLYGKSDLLENMPPFLGGGDMIKAVHLRNFTSNSLPHKFEAGTPAIAEGIGFASAIDYLEQVGMQQVESHEQTVIHYAMERLEEIPGVRLYGPSANNKGAVATFGLDDIHPHDVSQVLDRYGLAVRAGHHCAQPLHEKLGIPATTRASFYIYNTLQEVDKLVDGIYQVKKLFS